MSFHLANEYFLRLDSKSAATFTLHEKSFSVEPGTLFLVIHHGDNPVSHELDEKWLKAPVFTKVDIKQGYPEYLRQFKIKLDTITVSNHWRWYCIADTASNLRQLMSMAAAVKSIGGHVSIDESPPYCKAHHPLCVVMDISNPHLPPV